MATVTPINRPKGQCRAGLSAALDYVMQEKKIESDGRQLVTGINCQPEICYTQFISTKLQYGKCAGKMYFHFVQSFHPEENITPEEAHAVALELAQQWKDYEVIVATHTDAEHIHSHFIINSVSFENGRKLHFEKDDLTQLRKFSDEICMRHGLSICQPKKQQTSGIRQSEYHAAMRGESWKVALAIQIDECMKYAINKEQFIELMQSEGYQVKWTDSRANITYTTPDGKSCRDFRLHEEKYLKENMEYEFYIRAQQYATQHGGYESYAANGSEPQYREGRKYPESGYADAGELDRADQRGGADRTVRSAAPGERGASAHGRADGRETQSAGAVPDGAAQNVNFRDADSSTGTEREQYQALDADGEQRGAHTEQDAAGSRGSAEGVRETGWESQRGILHRTLQGERFRERVRESDTTADVPAHHHSGGVGIGAASVLAGLSAMDADSDDPEEQRRKMEAKATAQNLGAAIGMVAGSVIAANRHKSATEPDFQSNEQTQTWQQTM